MRTAGRYPHPVVAATLTAIVAAGCSSLASLVPTPTVGEQMPGPGYVTLAAEPETVAGPVDVLMTDPGDPGIRLAHTFDAGAAVQAHFLTSQGGYLLSALGGACALPIQLAANEEAQVLLTIGQDSACGLEITWQGDVEDPTRPPPRPGVLITNHDAGDATPEIEPAPATP